MTAKRHGARPPKSMLRRTFTLAAAAVLAIALFPAASASATDHAPDPRGTDRVCEDAASYDNPYPDLSETNAHYRNILCARDLAVAFGFEDGTFRPLESVTRAQMATFIANMIELERPLVGDPGHFSDVSANNEHYEAITGLAGVGVVEGFGDGTYAPFQTVTRAQMASFIARALDYIHTGAVDGSLPPSTGEQYFADLEGHTHRANINALAETQIAVGYGDGTYRQNNEVRRDEMASFVMRAYDYVDEVT